jgi:hypothetical protein
MNAKDALDNARRIGAAWEELTVLRRRAAGTNSRARRSGAQGQITADELAEKLAATEGKCSDCAKAFGLQRRNKWTICFRVPPQVRALLIGAETRAATKAPRGSVPPVPVESPGTLLRMFCDDDEEDDDT